MATLSTGRSFPRQLLTYAPELHEPWINTLGDELISSLNAGDELSAWLCVDRFVHFIFGYRQGVAGHAIMPTATAQSHFGMPTFLQLNLTEVTVLPHGLQMKTSEKEPVTFTFHSRVQRQPMGEVVEQMEKRARSFGGAAAQRTELLRCVRPFGAVGISEQFERRLMRAERGGPTAR